MNHLQPQTALGIAVVAYRTPDLARACVHSALRHVDVPANLIVMDTSDGPGVFTDPPPGTWVHYLDNVGYAKALAASLDEPETCTPYLLACNADVEFPAEGVRALLDLFAENPSLAILGPRQVTPGGLVCHAGIEHGGDHTGGRGYGEPDRGQYRDRLTSVEQVSGSVMLIRRAALDAIGGFGDYAMYYEDADLCIRARNAGWDVGYSGLATFIHYVAASPEPDMTSRAALAMQSHERFMQTYST